MRTKVIIICAFIIGAALALAGCGHKLMAPAGEQSVSVYPNEDAYMQMSKLKSSGGVAAMLGELGKNFVAKQVDGGTPVRIVGSTEQGYLVEITEGANKGVNGFVAKSSVE
ncbi:MAG: hypothetical protein ACREQB_13100 [Candidatus Binataceae bacterium]